MLAAAAPLRDAATLVLLADDPLRVLLIERHSSSSFLGGVHVFPGGAVDAADRVAASRRICAGRSDADASRLLGVESGGLAWWVAAARECHEETGIMLAVAAGPDGTGTDGTGTDGAGTDGAGDEGVGEWGEGFAGECAKAGLVLPTERTCYLAHWVGPVGAPRRFDTRFFVAAAPEGQTGVHGSDEVEDMTWLTPQEALERMAAGEMVLLPPTVAVLEWLECFTSVEDVMEASRAREAEVEDVLPRLLVSGGQVVVVLPGEDGYEEAGLQPAVDEVLAAGALLEGRYPRRPGGAR
ncbi:MAG: NUDIX hydrolase [Acidimicrobiales bacterium]